RCPECCAGVAAPRTEHPAANRARRAHREISPRARRCGSARRRRAPAAGISACGCSDRAVQWFSRKRRGRIMPMSQLRCLLSLLLLVSCSAFAQSFPSRPVTLIVPFSLGTGIDILARVIAPKLSEKWSQAVVVENKAGASGNIGTDFVAKAPADGYTLMVTVNTFTITPSLIRNTPYDIERDFSPI